MESKLNGGKSEPVDGRDEGNELKVIRRIVLDECDLCGRTMCMGLC